MKLYGVDLEKKITPVMARDALVRCFLKAHCADIGLETNDPAVTEEYVKNIIKKAFKDSGEDFENPTKQSIFSAMEQLKVFAANFRDQTIIQKHAEEMKKIAEKITP